MFPSAFIFYFIWGSFKLLPFYGYWLFGKRGFGGFFFEENMRFLGALNGAKTDTDLTNFQNLLNLFLLKPGLSRFFSMV